MRHILGGYRYLPLEEPEAPAAATSIQKNSGLPQGPADPSAGRLKHAFPRGEPIITFVKRPSGPL